MRTIDQEKLEGELLKPLGLIETEHGEPAISSYCTRESTPSKTWRRMCRAAQKLKPSLRPENDVLDP